MDDRSSEELALREIRHRLANSFQLITSFIQLRSSRVESEETQRELRAVADVIGSLGAIQERLAQPGGGDFGAFLEDIATNWRRLAGEDREIRIVVDAEPVEVSSRAASPLALIAHELVTNALEHAFPPDGSGTVTITFKRHGGVARLCVLDDGHGFDPAKARQVEPKSLGLVLVERLAAQIGGSFELSIGEGTLAAVSFELADAP